MNTFIYKKILRPILFRSFDAETIHHLTLRLLERTPLASLIMCGKKQPQDPFELWGLRFPNRLGLAAGLDKDAVALSAWQRLGFGFVEVGTVTPQPQAGNPRPRIFRCVKEEALINRMGFPNQGVEAMIQRLKKYRSYIQKNNASSSTLDPKNIILGINIGKGRETPIEEASADYLHAFEKLFPYGDFFVVNVSSPNTPGLRVLQNPEHLHPILRSLQNFNSMQSERKPLLLKLAPDIEPHQLESILEVALAHKLDGIVATNTTIDHSSVSLKETGGLSGKPLRAKSTEIIRSIYRLTDGKIPIIGVGGVFSRRDYLEKLDAGATLVQLYTGLIYEGPHIVHHVLK